MSRVLITFDFNGNHRKTNHVPLDPKGHFQMLSAAIDRANPRREHDVIVTAINWPLWCCNEDERMEAWHIHTRCREVISYPHDQNHQIGASWCLRMASEAAAAHGAEYLVHLADDVLLLTHTVEQLVDAIGPADYLGSTWGYSGTANTQVFVCRTVKFADLSRRHFLVDPIEFAWCGGNLEAYVWNKMVAFGLKMAVSEEWSHGRLYFHSHDIDHFLQKAKDLEATQHT